MDIDDYALFYEAFQLMSDGTRIAPTRDWCPRGLVNVMIADATVVPTSILPRSPSFICTP